MNLLRNDVEILKQEISRLHRNQPPTAIDSCHVKVFFPSPNTLVFEPAAVSNLLGCPSMQVTRISPKSIKVNIPKSCLYKAMQSSNPASHFVYVWKNRTSHPTTRDISLPAQQPCNSINIATWNCRGLHSSIPYIKHLISSGTDILVIQEHWLWPFELDELESIDPNFSYTAVCDSRLSPTSTLTRGCGGCAILRKKSIPAAPMSNLKSDRVCDIQIPIKDSNPLTILGVYMPSSDQPQDKYNEHLTTIDQVISTTPTSSPLLITGDLNCHLGQVGGSRSSAEPNDRGMLWKKLIDRHTLYVPSLSQLATGPVYTYSSGPNFTTLDYIIENVASSSAMVSCRVEDEHPLNTSDHLPITSELNLTLLTSTSATPDHAALNWTAAIRDGCVSQYAAETDRGIAPLLKKDYSSTEEIESDITLVSKLLIDSSYSTIPILRCHYNSSNRVYDSQLSSLCWQSRQAFQEWKAGGRPRSGPLYEARRESKKKVQQHLSKCRAQIERKKIQKRDQSFRSYHPRRFQTRTKRNGGESLLIEGSITSDPSTVLPHWADYFTRLSQSRCPENPNLQKVSDSIHELELQTHSDEKLILDTPFSPEEVCAAIKLLKRDSSAGPDQLSPRHLLHAGPLFSTWLSKIYNAISNLEAIPSQFKNGILIPIYKGKGKDPLSPTSYRGITLTSVIAKTLEILLLDRMLPILGDRCIPQLTQTAYQCGVSCTDATFTCQEIISKFIREGDVVYSCFYNLAAAFDTVEYPVLLSHLKDSGISGKTWRLIKHWYSGIHSHVRIGKMTSPSLTIGRGVRQGSVLSPILFLLVMDPLLQELKQKSCGPSVCGLYLGALSHADDICTLATSISDCQLQVNRVHKFTTSQGLTLNVDKYEAIISPSTPANTTHISAGQLKIPVTNSAKCLGALWCPNLSCKK